MKILIVVSYFGNLPWYFDMWRRSAEFNSSINFLLVTDAKINLASPNIKRLEVGLSDFCAKFSKVTGFDFQPNSYHKLCDFRPFYGLALEDEFNGYDFWGYSDMDIIYGDLAPLIDTANLGYDVFSPWIYTVGHLTLVKNNLINNKIFLKIDDIAARLKIKHSTFMDEGAFSQACLKTNGVKLFCVNSIDSELCKPYPFLGMTVQSNNKLSRIPKYCGVNVKNNKVFLVLRNGDIKEVLYFHFMGLKNKKLWYQIADDNPINFGFSDFGISSRLIEAQDFTGIAYWIKYIFLILPKEAWYFLRRFLPVKFLKSILLLIRRK